MFNEWKPKPWLPSDRLETLLAPTVPMALRLAVNSGISNPAFLAVNLIPDELLPLPYPYVLGDHNYDQITVQHLPTVPGVMGIDFATAFALCQLCVANKLLKIGKQEHAAYFIEAAGLSAGSCCSISGAEVMEKMYAAFEEDSDAVPWPDGILWPNDVSTWLEGFGIARDERA